MTPVTKKKISRKKQETLGKICKINCQNKKSNRDIKRLSGQNCPQHNNSKEGSEKWRDTEFNSKE